MGIIPSVQTIIRHSSVQHMNIIPSVQAIIRQCLQRFNIQLFHKKNKNTYTTQFSSTYEYHSFCTNSYTTHSSVQHMGIIPSVQTIIRHSSVQHMNIIPSVQTVIRHIVQFNIWVSFLLYKQLYDTVQFNI